MELHPGCVICKRTNTAKADILDPETKEVLVRKGEFAIECDGIPADPEAHLLQITDPLLVKAVGEEAVRKVARLNDPVLWAEDNVLVYDPEESKRIPWKPRGATAENIKKYGLTEDAAYYQDLMVRCSAKRTLLRVGRRSGKTWGLVMRALHRLYTRNKYTILVIAPALPQLDIIFDTLTDFIYNSPTLNSDKIRSVKAPNRMIELPNGSVMRGFVSGSESIRGQKGDEIIIDEADYLTTDDFSSIIAILSDHSQTRFAVSSTPSGAREKFYEWDQNPEFRSFHFPSMCRPNWTRAMEIEQRRENPGNKYIHEILADYGELDAGVFQHSHISDALVDGAYDYARELPHPDFLYAIGVDWNPVNGTEVYVVGADTQAGDGEKIYRVVDHGQVFREGNTQIQACNEIIRLNRKWNPFAIFVDRGAGSAQIEILNEAGAKAPPNTPDKRLETIIEAIDFGSKVEIRNPATQQVEKVYAKPAVVENAVRMFEANTVQLSQRDKDLERQLKGYQVAKIGHNRPVYSMISDDITDHRLDAFMLALFAFMMKFSKFGQPTTTQDVGFAGFYMDKIDEARRNSVAVLKQTTKRDREIDDLGLVAISEVGNGTWVPESRFNHQKSIAVANSRTDSRAGFIERPNISSSKERSWR